MKYMETGPETYKQLTDEQIKIVESIAKKTVELVKPYDYILVSGRSRSLSRTLLLASGIDPKKIVSINAYTNASLYKTKQTNNTTHEQRVGMFRNFLEKSGVKLPASICVVDDLSRSGTKAMSYLVIMNGIRELSSFRYVTLTLSKDFEELRKRLEALYGDYFPNYFYNASNLLSAEEQLKAYQLFDEIAYLLDVTHQEYNSGITESNKQGDEKEKRVARDALHQLYLVIKNKMSRT